MEETDGGGTRAAGGSWKLLRPAEDVPVPVLLPAEPGVQPGPRSGPLSVQRPLGAPAGPAETPSAANPAARPTGGQRAAPAASSAPHVRRASSARSAAVSRPLHILFYLFFLYADPGSSGLIRRNKTKTEKDETNKRKREKKKTVGGLYTVRNDRFRLKPVDGAL